MKISLSNDFFSITMKMQRHYGDPFAQDAERDKMLYCCRKIPVLFMVLAFLLLLCGCSGRGEIVELPPVTQDAGQEKETEETQGAGKESEGEPAELWVVHVCGAVNRPGVYSFPEGSRVCDALNAAGGLREDASATWANQAALLSDGMQIVVPTEEEAQGLTAGDAGTAASQSGSGLVNINTASAEELMTLPGIGQTRAEAILAYRQECGRFETIEDIMKVDGIKEGSFEKLKSKITV